MPAPRPLVFATGALALSVLLPPAFAAAPSAPAPSAPVREPGFSRLTKDFVGMWHSAGDTADIRITPTGASGVLVLARDRFEASGFASPSGVVALTRTPPANVDVVFNTGILRLERLGPASLRVRLYTDLVGAPVREETWLRAAEPLPARTPGPEDWRPPGEGLPAFGEYVYVEVLPEAVIKTAAVYPDRAREAGIDGQVIVQALVGADGLVKDTRVIKSIPELDEAAVASVRQWRFKPALTKGQPVAAWVAVPVKFSLH